jgi:hypothetical protein
VWLKDLNEPELGSVVFEYVKALVSILASLWLIRLGYRKPMIADKHGINRRSSACRLEKRLGAPRILQSRFDRPEPLAMTPAAFDDACR